MEGVEVEEGVMRVLLVDDSPVDRKVAQLLLNSGSCAGSFHGQLSIQLKLVSLRSQICSVLLPSFYF
jgi:CheY-like chemotaxis protein